MHWAEPVWLILLLFSPLPWLLDRARPRLPWPTLDGFRLKGWRHRVARLSASASGLLRGLVVVCLAAAMARPQTVAGRTRIAAQGVAIVVLLDHSSSMNAEDFAPS